MSALDFRPPLDPFAVAFGAAAVITPPPGIGGPVDVTVINPARSAGSSLGADPAMPRTHSSFCIRRDEMAAVPIGSEMQVLAGPDAGLWMVDRVDPADPEYLELVARRT